MSESGDDFRAFLTTIWHCINVVDGKIRFIPYLDFDMMRELRVALIGNSSNRRIYFDAMLSMFLTERTTMIQLKFIFKMTRNFTNFTH